MSRTCTVCGLEFIRSGRTKFCGQECRQRFKREYEKAYRLSRVTEPPEPERFEPFPSHIDREGFSHWLSGFSAGEATFGLRATMLKDRARPRPQYHAFFRITLRDDDDDVLNLIRSFWRCGCISFQENARYRLANAKPIVAYSVQKVADLMHTVVVHFDRYPLHAKKRNDFVIWKRGIGLMAEVQDRPKIGRLVAGGIMPTWTDADRATFLCLSQELKNQRKYIDSHS